MESRSILTNQEMNQVEVSGDPEPLCREHFKDNGEVILNQKKTIPVKEVLVKSSQKT